MSWDAGTGDSGWGSGPATNDNFTSQDARSGFDHGGDAKATNGYDDTNGHGDTNGHSDADGGYGGGNDGACFNCGEHGCVWLPIYALHILTILVLQPHEVRMPKPSCSS